MYFVVVTDSCISHPESKHDSDCACEITSRHNRFHVYYMCIYCQILATHNDYKQLYQPQVEGKVFLFVTSLTRVYATQFKDRKEFLSDAWPIGLPTTSFKEFKELFS